MVFGISIKHVQSVQLIDSRLCDPWPLGSRPAQPKESTNWSPLTYSHSQRCAEMQGQFHLCPFEHLHLFMKQFAYHDNGIITWISVPEEQINCSYIVSNPEPSEIQSWSSHSSFGLFFETRACLGGLLMIFDMSNVITKQYTKRSGNICFCTERLDFHQGS